MQFQLKKVSFKHWVFDFLQKIYIYILETTKAFLLPYLSQIPYIIYFPPVDVHLFIYLYFIFAL